MIPLKERERLRTYLALLTLPESLVPETRISRVVLSMQANYLILSIMHRAKQLGCLQHLKIGIIGCGVIGKLLLNNLLVLTKENLKISNIMVSTRRPEELHIYSNLGVSCMFNNEFCMEESDLLFFCTPDTLDNWIFTSLSNEAASRQNNPNRDLPLTIAHMSQRLNSVQLEHIMNLKEACVKLHAPREVLLGKEYLVSGRETEVLSSEYEELEELLYEGSEETIKDWLRVQGSKEEPSKEEWMKRQRMWRMTFYNYRK